MFPAALAGWRFRNGISRLHRGEHRPPQGIIPDWLEFDQNIRPDEEINRSESRTPSGDIPATGLLAERVLAADS